MGMLTSLLLSGESGTGKEIAAQVFHAAGATRKAPFVALRGYPGRRVV
jgi:DNA-binding NtrC family response regulator